MASLLQRRFLCSKVPKKWAVKQVTKTNFAECLEEIKQHITSSDFVALSLQKTGSFTAPWHRALPFDTADIAYCKVKYAAERFELLQFALCPFILRASKLIAHPYNFLLFPRDEWKVGMPSYSFSCQPSHLTSMAREGFDFNACIYDGISYLSRVQEAAAKVRIGNPIPSSHVKILNSTPSVADKIFVERIKSRVKNWKSLCQKSSSKTDDSLLTTLKKVIMEYEYYGSRPCMKIDVCSERQMQLTLLMLQEFADDIIPLIIPAKGGTTEAVRVVLTSSKEDKDLFEEELKCLEEEQNMKLRGFREVIDLISASQKPVVSHNSLNDFAFIYSKFLAPLPCKLDEFKSSISQIFPYIFDVSHLMKVIAPLRNKNSIPVAVSYLNNHFDAPVDIEISPQVAGHEGNVHGHNVVRISQLFAKLCSILKSSCSDAVSDNQLLPPALEEHTNVFSAFSTSFQESIDEDVTVWARNTRKINCDQLVFLWGYGSGVTAGKLKGLLHGSHYIFSEEFDVRLVDKNCAIVVFWQPGLSKHFLDVMNSEEICGFLKEMVSEGLRAVSYDTYRRACKLGIWEADLRESLDKALEVSESIDEANPRRYPREICWSNDSLINLDEL